MMPLLLNLEIFVSLWPSRQFTHYRSGSRTFTWHASYAMARSMARPLVYPR